MHKSKTALITGAAQRLGKAMAQMLHRKGYNILIHYHTSEVEAQHLFNELNELSAGSAMMLNADLTQLSDIQQLQAPALKQWGSLDVLINNAARFYPGKLEETSPADWDDMINSNLRAPFFLCQTFADALKAANGCVVNMVDIYADRPLDDHPVYSIAKAGLTMLTKSLAKEMGPEVRVNGIAPGAILWPKENSEENHEIQQGILNRTVLKKTGSAEDICRTAFFLIEKAPYVTGQIIKVDGGRSLNQ